MTYCPETWPQSYPSPDAIVDASLAANNEQEEIAAILSLGISESDAKYFAYLVANASHSVWYFPMIQATKDFQNHPPSGLPNSI